MILSVFPRLKHVTLRRISEQNSWEWAQVERNNGADITWDYLRGSDYLEGGGYLNVSD